MNIKPFVSFLQRGKERICLGLLCLFSFALFALFNLKLILNLCFISTFFFYPGLLITRSAVRARPGEPFKPTFFPLQNRNLGNYARTAASWQFALGNADCGYIVAILCQFLLRFLNFLLIPLKRNPRNQSKLYVYFSDAEV